MSSNSHREEDPDQTSIQFDALHLSGSKNHTRLDVEVHDHTALHYSVELQSEKTWDKTANTLVVQNPRLISEDLIEIEQKLHITDQLQQSTEAPMSGKVFDLRQAADHSERHARNIQNTTSKNYDNLVDQGKSMDSGRGTTLGLIYLR